jgi:hypothetical protein
MPEKKRVQDIVPTNKRTIRNVPTKKHVPVEEEEGEELVPIRRAPPSISISRSQTRFEQTPPPRRMSTPERIERTEKVSPPGKRRFGGILLTFGIIFVGIAIIAVALSLLYSKAAVTITPKTAEIDINGTFTAKKQGDASATSGSLVYETATTTLSVSQLVPATEGPLIETKAKGTVTFYNEQTVQQKLVPGTRIANADGDIYRTSATIVIPAGKAGAPGTITTAVVADQAGAEYNMPLTGSTAFTVVAYKGTPKFETVYAKLKTAITGGFSGKKTTINADVQKAAVTSLKESLTTKLIDTVKTQIPKDAVLYPGAYVIDYETPDPVSKGAEGAEVTVKGTLSAAYFKKTTLIKSIAAKDLDKFPAPTYNINGLEDMKFSVVNSKDFSPRKATPLIFTLKGPVNLVGTFSETALKDELKGTYLKDSNAIFAKYPSIANAYALITPFWMRSFPNSADKIIIEIKK